MLRLILPLALLLPLVTTAAPNTTVDPRLETNPPLLNVRALPRKATDARNQLSTKLKLDHSARAMQTQTKIPKVFVIKPSPTPLTTGFDLIEQGGQLILKFRPASPGERLASERALVIQVSPRPPLEISPPVITESNWPKGMSQMVLTVKNAKPGQSSALAGAAAFWVCKPGKPGAKENCRRLKADFALLFKP